MDALRMALLWTHIIFGFTALLAGSVALSAVKGGPAHKRSGRVFHYSMLTVAFSALGLSVIRPNSFLFYIAVFALFQSYSGYRSIRNKSLRPNTLDWIVPALALLTSALMLISGKMVLMVFGGIMLLLSLRDLQTFYKILKGLPLPPKQWLTRHIGMMIGAYIATVTAFVVVNVGNINPAWLPWLAPTALGMPLMAYWMRKARGTAWKTAALLCLLVPVTGSAQEAVVPDTFYTAEYLDKSTRFAWTTLGGDLNLLSGGQIDLPGQPNTAFPASVNPRLTIGGIHFWGHADFYVTFPLPVRLGGTGEAFEKVLNSEGVETGARLYPFALKEGALRPYVGISFKARSFRVELKDVDYGKGASLSQRFVSPYQLGLTYAGSRYIVSGGLQYLPNNKFDYALSPEAMTSGRFQPLSFTLGLVRYWDLDRGARTERGFRQENIMHYLLEREGKLSAFYWGIGPSANIQLHRSPYLKENHPALANRLTGGTIMPDVSFGYHFAGIDANVGVSYRFMQDRFAAFDTRISMRRHSFMLESYKFLFNYLGFVPYLGLTVSSEHLQTTINDRKVSSNPIAVGIIAGWDIRVTRTGTSLLRTNLRYAPGLGMKIDGSKMRYDHLEFNFIQYVQYIGRSKFYSKYRGK